MDEAIQGAIVGGLVGESVAVLAVLVLGLLQRQRCCPECQTSLPRWRRPKNRRQRLWGGWTCPQCGCEVDRKGKKVEA